MINHYSLKKSRRRYRADSHWTGEYRSPEPSLFLKVAGRIGDRVYNCVDCFFRGVPIKPSFENNNSNLLSINPDTGYCQVWELNQDIFDIAINDIEISLRYLFPASCRHFLDNAYHRVCLYFQADFTVQEESSVLKEENFILNKKPGEESTKKMILLQSCVEYKRGKLLIFKDWIKVAIRISNRYFPLRNIRKPYYLLGNFAPVKYEYDLENQNCMIRGPDKPKLNSSIFFHIRN